MAHNGGADFNVHREIPLGQFASGSRDGSAEIWETGYDSGKMAALWWSMTRDGTGRKRPHAGIERSAATDGERHLFAPPLSLAAI